MNLKISGLKHELIMRILENQSCIPTTTVSVCVANEKTNCQQFMMLPDLCSSPIVENDNGIVDEHFDKHHNFFSENGMQSSIKEAG